MMARELVSGPEPDDIMVGDPVRLGGKGPVGWVDSINADYAVVAWSGNDRDILPLASLRRAPQRGAAYDTWRGE